MIAAIRGAITVENDTKQEIINATKELLSNIIEKNKLNIENIIFILFTMTKDLKSTFPAVAARMMGLNEIPLICAQELEIEESLEKCIRVLLLVEVNSKESIKHIYLKKAVNLRKDLMRWIIWQRLI